MGYPSAFMARRRIGNRASSLGQTQQHLGRQGKEGKENVNDWGETSLTGVPMPVAEWGVSTALMCIL